jgi:hypothetical protein
LDINGDVVTYPSLEPKQNIDHLPVFDGNTGDYLGLFGELNKKN